MCGAFANETVSIFLGACLAIFVMPNKVFAWFETIASLIKIFVFALLLLLSLAIVCGAGPQGYLHDGSFWRDLPPFKNGFSVSNSCSIVVIAAHLLNGSGLCKCGTPCNMGSW